MNTLNSFLKHMHKNKNYMNRTYIFIELLSMVFYLAVKFSLTFIDEKFIIS